MTTTYAYHALQEGEIRLLMLQPGSRTAPLRGYLIHRVFASPGDAPKFDALSYEWGSQADPESIVISDGGGRLPYLRSTILPGAAWADRPGMGTVRIGRNLAAALRRLRHRRLPRVLWCDSLCVNQDDLEERAKQVLRMGDIYRFAAKVVVWLGPAADDSDLAMAALTEAGRSVVLDLTDLSLAVTAGSHKAYADKDQPPPFSARQWRAIKSLFARTWFKRLWVWQEISLANAAAVVVCGETKMSWSVLRNAAQCLRFKPQGEFVNEEEDALYVANLANLLDLSVVQLSDKICDVVRYTRFCEYTDPRDRVYAILNICRPVVPRALEITPDYALEPRKVYRQFVSALDEFQRLKLLELCEMCARPSWVPDLSRRPNLKNGGTFRLGWASGMSSGRFEIFGDSVRVSAIHCGMLGDGPSQSIPDICEWDLVLATVVGMTFKHVGRSTSPGWSDGTAEKLISGLLCGYNFDVSGSSNYPSVLEATEVLKGWVIAIEASDGQSTDVPLTAEGSKLVDTLLFTLSGRSCHMTTDGDFVIVPSVARVGDVISVILGCSFPLVLRPVDGSDEDDRRYVVVGVCYHPGYMWGEAILGDMPQGWSCRELQGRRRGYSCMAFFSPSESERLAAWRENTVLDALDTSDILSLTEDPRMGDLPPGWRSAVYTSGGGRVLCWVNDGLEEITWFDPRLDRTLLKERGVPIQEIILD